MGTIGTLPGDRLAGLTEDLFHKLRKGVITLDELALFIQRKNPFSSNFVVTVDYTLSLADIILAGHYDWVSEKISLESHPRGSGVVERPVFLHRYDRPVHCREVIEEMDKVGHEPASLRDLLAFGAKYPDEQLSFPIVALGEGGPLMPNLCKSGSKRGLDLCRVSRGWHSGFRFLACKKAPDPTTWGFHGLSKM